MLYLFQILFALFALVAVINVFRRVKDGSLSLRGASFWGVMWVCAVAVVMYPNSTAVLAQLFGIGRGVDLVIYVSLAAMFFLLFRLHIKVEGIRREVTRAVRREALDDVGSRAR